MTTAVQVTALAAQAIGDAWQIEGNARGLVGGVGPRLGHGTVEGQLELDPITGQ
jgi:hypothetical protein